MEVPLEAVFHLHGWGVRFEVPTLELQEAVIHWSRRFPSPHRAVEINISLYGVASSQFSPPLPSAPQRGKRGVVVQGWAEEEEFYLLFSEVAWVRGNWARGEASVYAREEALAQTAFLLHGVLKPTLLELLKGRGLYPLHAAALQRRQQGMLLLGPRGCGKTTLTAALVRAGWQFLADDLVLLRRSAAGPEVLAFPEDLDLPPDVAAAFPETRPLLLATPQAGKIPCPVEILSSTSVAWQAVPRLLLFLQPVPKPRSDLRPLSPSATLPAVVEQSGFLGSRETAAEHLALLRDLVHQTVAYHLRLGQDLRAAVQLLEGLIRSS
ncbi:MAG TPA: hypothetical protein EYP85_07535 [Armatimonadetes bacterium]|nr:hypothetical protein [Armatimonadota bacterium]